MFKRILLVAIILATVCVSASADYVWFAFNGSLGPTDTLTGWTDTFTLPKFNPALGTLDSVEFTMVGNILGAGEAENTQPVKPAILTVSFTGALTLTRPDTTALVTVAPTTGTVTESVSAFDGVQDFLGTDTASFTGLVGTETGNLSDTLAADLALFTGAGDITLGIASAPGTVLFESPFPGHFKNRILNELSSVNLKIKYLYAPVVIPEPGSLALLALGLPVLGLWYRRKRQS